MEKKYFFNQSSKYHNSRCSSVTEGCVRGWSRKYLRLAHQRPDSSFLLFHLLELAIGCPSSNPPIHYASQGFQALFTPPLSFSSLCHSLERFQGFRIVERTALHEESECAEPVRKRAGLNDLEEEAGFG